MEIIPLHLPVSQHTGALQDRAGGNYPAAPASIPAHGRHAASSGWKLSRCTCQHPSTRAPCRIERVEIIPLRLPVSQHTGAVQDRAGGNYPAAPASIPAHGRRAGSSGWKSSRCACQHLSTQAPCSIERVEFIPLHLPASQHTDAMQHRAGALERERTMFEPEQGSKLQPAEMAKQKTKEKPAPVWFRQWRVFSLVSDLHISLGESGHT